MLMDSCRIKAQNRDFYLHKYKVDNIINKYEKRYSSLTTQQQQRFITLKMKCVFSFVDYLIQIGNRTESQNVLNELTNNTTINLQSDSIQWMNYLYHQGKACFMPYEINKNKETILHGYDCLIQCYILAMRRHDNRYLALSMQMLSQYFAHESISQLANEFDAPAIRYLNEDGVSGELLAGNLAERALDISLTLNDTYLTNESWRLLARCYFLIDNAPKSLECLNMALANPSTDSMPALKASIAEQMSISFAALDDKYNSDVYRNLYLDLQDSTRQDRQLEARAIELQEQTQRIWLLVAIAAGVFVLLVITIFILIRLRRRKVNQASQMEEEIETLKEKQQQQLLQLSNAQRAFVEQEARVSVINGIIPLIDRMKLSLEKESKRNDDETLRYENENGNENKNKNGGSYFLEYAKEVAMDIDAQNNMLSSWIKLHHGNIQPKIETLPLQTIINIIKKNAPTLSRQAIQLEAPDTTLKVKADKALTLFLFNTLIDNARKAMPKGGRIEIKCSGNNDVAEISITDTGKGMTDEQVQHLFEYRAINDETLSSSNNAAGQSHGFGLQNCRGIMDRYRKISSLFSVCTIFAQSALDKGTTITFRLPLAKMILTLLMSVLTGALTSVHAAPTSNDAPADTASFVNNPIVVRYADSLYSCNVQQRYADAMQYADSCIATMQNDTLVDESIRLAIYNETAIAALALHQWDKYSLYNYLYTKLYKETTADKSLPYYCHRKERSEMIANIAMLVVMILILSLIPIFWFMYLRHIVTHRKKLRNEITELKESCAIAQKEYEKLHVLNNIIDNQLSTVKHETMYYPARLLQILNEGDSREALNTAVFYSELYSTLATKVLNNSLNAYTFSMEKNNVTSFFPNIEGVPATASNNNADADTGSGSDGEEITVIANAELLSLTRLLLKRHNGGKTPTYRLTPSDPSSTRRMPSEENGRRYVVIDVELSRTTINPLLWQELFTPHTPEVDFLILRQVMRDIGAATNHYGSGINIIQNRTLKIQITLPRV